MGQIKNIKLHIVTDIKDRSYLTNVVNRYDHFNSSTITMANTIEKPTATEPAEEKTVEKEAITEPESITKPKTTTPDATETEKNGNGHTDKQNGDDKTEEETNVQVESSKVDDAEEKDDTTLKRKDAPADTEESPKKQKLVDSEEKDAEPAVTTVEV